MNRIRKNQNEQYINDSLGGLKPASFELIKSFRQTTDHEDGYNEQTGINENTRHTVCAVQPKTRTAFERVGNSYTKAPLNRLGQTQRMISDVSVNRAFAHKLSQSKLRSDLKGPLINNDLVRYRKLMKDKINEYQDSINKTYSGDDRKFLSSNTQSSDPVQLDNPDSSLPMQGSNVQNFYNNLRQKYGL
jgi:hypothetical protein